MTETKYCVNCIYYHKVSFDTQQRYMECRYWSYKDKVTGKHIYPLAREMRAAADNCGPTAKWFKPNTHNRFRKWVKDQLDHL